MVFGWKRKSNGHRPHEEKGEGVTGLLESGIVMEGKMHVSSGMVRLNCQFKGEIVSPGTIVVAEKGELVANIEAKQISISGKVKGNIHATQHLELTDESVLLGDIETPSLAIEPGACFKGRCHMTTLAPDKSTPNPAESKPLP